MMKQKNETLSCEDVINHVSTRLTMQNASRRDVIYHVSATWTKAAVDTPITNRRKQEKNPSTNRHVERSRDICVEKKPPFLAVKQSLTISRCLDFARHDGIIPDGIPHDGIIPDGIPHDGIPPVIARRNEPFPPPQICNPCLI